MVADCMKDINDDDMSDTDDPDLLAELEDIQDEEDESSNTQSGASDGVSVGVSHSFLDTIRERLALYREAEAVARASGDSSRARRYNRGVNTLADLERRAAEGGAVREEDIPPLISVPGKPRSPEDTEPSHIVNTQPQPPPVREQPLQVGEQPPPPLPSRSGSLAQAQIGRINSQLSEIQTAK